MNYISSPQSAFTESFYDLLSRTKHSKKAKQVKPQDMWELLIAHQDGSITCWDQRHFDKPTRVIQIHNDDCRSVEYDPSCKYFASTSFDQTCKIYDIQSGQVTSTLKSHSDRVVLAKWHPFFPILLTTSADCQVKLFAAQDFIDTY